MTATASQWRIAAHERMYVLKVPYDERQFARTHGAMWDAQLRSHIWVGRTLPAELTEYSSQDYSWERWLEDDYNNTMLAPTITQTSLTVRDHQQHAAELIAHAAMLGYRGFLEADDVGLGKTLSAVHGVKLIARQRPISNILVVSPLAVVPHWRRTIAAAGDGSLRWCVINYERLKYLLDPPSSAYTAKRTSTRNRRIAREGNSKVTWDIIIADESHRLRHASSQRSQAMTRLSRWDQPAIHAPFVVWMSATAGQNPTELSYLAPLLLQTCGGTAQSLQDFGAWLHEQGFSVDQTSRGNWKWTDNPQQQEHDTQKLQGLLFAEPNPVAVRRLPTDIAGWPEINRHLMPVELTVAQKVQYLSAWTEFRRELHLSAKGRDPRSALAAQTRFRQKSSLIRVSATVEHVLDALENGHHVGVSTAFVETADRITTALTDKGITVAQVDGTNRTNREQQRLMFQQGTAQVVVFTVTEGISLHAGETLPNGHVGNSAPRSLFVHDVRYSGIDTLQIEGRMHRDGQFCPVTYLFGANTVEERITQTLINRIETTKRLVGDDVHLIQQLSSILTNFDTPTPTSPPADPPPSADPPPPAA